MSVYVLEVKTYNLYFKRQMLLLSKIVVTVRVFFFEIIIF